MVWILCTSLILFYFSDILHLAPKSKAAKIFEDFQKTMENTTTTTTPIPPGKYSLLIFRVNN
jgi:hypothetical protein